jgi:hypothetical protein
LARAETGALGPVLESLLASDALDAVYLHVVARSLSARRSCDVGDDSGGNSDGGGGSDGDVDKEREAVLSDETSDDRVAVELPAALRALSASSGGRFIVTLVDDLGPLTKLVPTLWAERDPSTVILWADGERVYSPLWAAELARFCLGGGGGTAHAVSAFTVVDDDAASSCWTWRAAVDHAERVDVVEARDGACAARAAFGGTAADADDERASFAAFVEAAVAEAQCGDEASREWILADDLVISRFLAARNVTRAAVRTPLLERGAAACDAHDIRDTRAAAAAAAFSAGVDGTEDNKAVPCCEDARDGAPCDGRMARGGSRHDSTIAERVARHIAATTAMEVEVGALATTGVGG